MFIRDTRDTPGTPTRGSYLKLFQVCFFLVYTRLAYSGIGTGRLRWRRFILQI